jgi:hypothetical protein
MLDWLRNLFGGSITEPSHPGRVSAEFGRVAASYPLWPIVLGLAWLVALLAVLDGFHYTAFGLLAVATYANYRWWSIIPSWFYSGDVCAGAVVSTEPLLVASLNDLTSGAGSYPAVKVRREPASRFDAATLKIGQPVASVAMYDGTLTDRHFTNFHPRAAQCATSDAATIKRLLSEIDKDRWTALQAAIRQLPQPIKPGLYRLPTAEG